MPIITSVFLSFFHYDFGNKKSVKPYRLFFALTVFSVDIFSGWFSLTIICFRAYTLFWTLSYSSLHEVTHGLHDLNTRLFELTTQLFKVTYRLNDLKLSLFQVNYQLNELNLSLFRMNIRPNDFNTRLFDLKGQLKDLNTRLNDFNMLPLDLTRRSPVFFCVLTDFYDLHEGFKAFSGDQL